MPHANGYNYFPSHRLKDRWTVHKLKIQDKLQLFQMLLAMDPLLLGFNPSDRLPFADLPSPEVYTSILCQLWGVDWGGS